MAQKSFWQRVCSFDRLGLIFLGINLILIAPSLFPNLSDIGPWDEMAYVVSGRLLADKGEWPVIANNPLTSAFYALTYLPYRASPFWLVHSRTLGKILSFVLLWLSVYLIARQLEEVAHPAIALGLFLTAPFVLEFLIFPSDPLFAALAGLALWQLLAFYRSRQLRHVWWGSLFLALSALARNDGLLLFPIFTLWGILLGWRSRRVLAAALASILPFVWIVGGYMLVYGLRTGNYGLGTLERTYDNFEAGQEIVLANREGMNPVAAAKLEAQRAFGTAEENNYSVFRAIRRNPGMYLKRLKLLLRSLPENVLRAYGIRFAPVLFLLCLRGGWELVRRRHSMLLLLFLSWPLHLASGFVITLFRPGHLLFPFYVVLVLAAIGLQAVVANLGTRERFAWFSLLILITGAAILTDKLAIAYACGLFLAGLVAVHLATWPHAPVRYENALLVTLCVGLILHGPYPSPKIRVLGKEPKEQALLAMTEALPQDALVAAGSLFPTAAKMRLANLASTDIPLDLPSEQFLSWLRNQGIQAIYVDPTLYSDNPRLWSLIEPHIGHELERLISLDDGNIQILVFASP